MMLPNVFPGLLGTHVPSASAIRFSLPSALLLGRSAEGVWWVPVSLASSLKGCWMLQPGLMSPEPHFLPSLPVPEFRQDLACFRTLPNLV